MVHDVKKSMTYSSNSYFDTDFQVGENDRKTIRVMVSKSDTSRCQLLLDKFNSEQPLQLSNLRPVASGTIFMNQITTIKDLPTHLIPIPFQPISTSITTDISNILDKNTSGTFNNSGSLCWLGAESLTPKKSKKGEKRVRDARITGSTASIDTSIWEQNIEQIQEGQFYNLTNWRLKHIYGKKLSTTQATVTTTAEKQDLTSAKDHHKTQNILCCPDILNVHVNIYPVCNNKDCKKKVSPNPG